MTTDRETTTASVDRCPHAIECPSSARYVENLNEPRIMSHQSITDIASIAGLLISLYLLFINIKNRKTQLSTYYISRGLHRSSDIVFNYINAEQLDGRFLVKLVLFNPGSVASIIHSVAVFKQVKNPSFLTRAFKPIVPERVEDAYWWPTQDESQKEPGYLDDEYKNLYVKDIRIILVSIPGWIDRAKYEFEIRTNNGYQTKMTNIDEVKGRTRFSHHYDVWFAEK